MNIVSSTKLRNNLADTIKIVSEKKNYVVVTQRGRMKAAIMDIDMFEDMLELTDPEYLKSIREAREQYKRGEYYTLEEVFGNI
jgi:prevent-host-death family protein